MFDQIIWFEEQNFFKKKKWMLTPLAKAVLIYTKKFHFLNLKKQSHSSYHGRCGPRVGDHQVKRHSEKPFLRFPFGAGILQDFSF